MVTIRALAEYRSSFASSIEANWAARKRGSLFGLRGTNDAGEALV
jgi:hypothetical protein